MVQNFAYEDVEKYQQHECKTFTDTAQSGMQSTMNLQYERLEHDASSTTRPLHPEACTRHKSVHHDYHQQRYHFEKIDPSDGVRVSHFPLPARNFDVSLSSPDVFHQRIVTPERYVPKTPVQRFKQVHSMANHHTCPCMCRSENTVHSHHNASMLVNDNVVKMKSKSLPRESYYEIGNLGHSASSHIIDTHEDLYDSRSTEIVNTENTIDLQNSQLPQNHESGDTTSLEEVERNKGKCGMKCCKMSKGAIVFVSVLVVLLVAMAAGFVVFESITASPQCGVFPEEFKRHKNNVAITLIKKKQTVAQSYSKTNLSRKRRVVGGYNTRTGEFPWQAIIWLENQGMKCGATVILKNWIVTAAHCTNQFTNPNVWTVYAGLSNLKRLTEPHIQKRQVTAVHPHSLFEGVNDKFDYDICLMQVGEDFIFNSKVQPACIPPISLDPEFTLSLNCFVSGWGETVYNANDEASAILQHAEVDLFDRDTCKSFLGHLSNRMICAGKKDGRSDACKGDSGGPLSCYSERDKSWYLYGVVSSGKKCGLPQTPGVYIQTSAMAEWIWESISEIEKY